MRLEILLFAAARDAADCDRIFVEVGDAARAGDVIDAIGKQLPQLEPLLPSCRLAIDCAYVSAETVVSETCEEIALIPPVSGG